MTTQAKTGYVVLFKVGNGATPEVFTAIAEVKRIKLPGMSRDAIDVSHTESPNQVREFIPGMIDAGEVEFDFNYVPGSASSQVLLAEIYADSGNKQVVWPTGNILSFNGFATNIDAGEANLDDGMTGTGTYKVSGTPTFS